MDWQNEFDIDGGKRIGPGIVSIVFLVILLATAGTYFLYHKNDVQAFSDTARERILEMKQIRNQN
jgi:hypothetical protein